MVYVMAWCGNGKSDDRGGDGCVKRPISYYLYCAWRMHHYDDSKCEFASELARNQQCLCRFVYTSFPRSDRWYMVGK